MTKTPFFNKMLVNNPVFGDRRYHLTDTTYQFKVEYISVLTKKVSLVRKHFFIQHITFS